MKETSNENKMLLLKFISTVEVEAILLTLSVPFSCVMNDEPFILQYQLVTSCDANRNSHASAPPFYIKPSGTNAHGSRGANSPSAEAHLNRTGHVHPRAGSGEACPPSRLGVRWRRTRRLFRVFFSPRWLSESCGIGATLACQPVRGCRGIGCPVSCSVPTPLKAHRAPCFCRCQLEFPRLCRS
jgi:hypothetical protein